MGQQKVPVLKPKGYHFAREPPGGRVQGGWVKGGGVHGGGGSREGGSRGGGALPGRNSVRGGASRA